MVHEISQPLATVATYAHVCRRLMANSPADFELLDQTIAKVEFEVRRAGEIVERLRDFLGRSEPRWGPVDLTDMTRKVVGALADLARSHDVIVRIVAEPLSQIAADRTQIEQVAVNLVRNAIEAVGDCSNKEKWVCIRLRRADAEVEMAVEDNGDGVPLDLAGRLFEPFETNKQRGMGLGLSLSREIGRRMADDSVGCDSHLRRALRAAIAPRPGRTPVTRDPTVYVVEDDPGMQDALTLLLQSAGFDVRGYRSAETFLAEADCSEPICLLTDVRLPDMDGIALYRHLVRLGLAPAAVVITAHGDIPMAVAALKEGVVDFLEKPFDPAMLLDSIRDASQRAVAIQAQKAHVADIEARRLTLTPREGEVLALLVEGTPNKVIAAKLDMSIRTAEHHRAHIMEKMGVRSLSQLIKLLMHRSSL